MKNYDEEFAELFPARELPRDHRQAQISDWARRAFSEVEATSIPQRGLRLLEEAVEAFQACGGDAALAHRLVDFVFARPSGTIGQELGGVAVTVLALAAAAGLSADEEECREVDRVLSKSIHEFRARNASKNAAGFRLARHPPAARDSTRHLESEPPLDIECARPAAPAVHVLSQEDQPYGSVRRCCNHCGVMLWGADAPQHVDSWADWRARPDRCALTERQDAPEGNRSA